jgi:CubicO group peptidase (beta-lactamase class C family)
MKRPTTHRRVAPMHTACVTVIVAAVLSTTSCLSIRDERGLSTFLESRMKALGAASFGAGILRGDQLVWSHAWGIADRGAGTPATVDTVYRICSISKSITGLAAMTLVEQGRLDLDADISTYLPVSIRNPWHPDTPVTARMLMNHSSSIVDDWTYFDPLVRVHEPALSLEQLVRGGLTPEGHPEWKRSFIDAKPGTTAVYSNIGVTVLAWVVESIAGMPYDAWSAEVVLDPLSLRDVSWFESRLPDGLTLARPYGFHGEALDQWHVPQWPAGSLLCSVRSFAPLAAVFVNRGVVHRTRILKQSSLEEMERITAGHYGLSVLAWANHPGEPGLRGHFGDMPGFHTGFLYDPGARVGAFYFANGQFYHTMLRAEVESALIAAARNFAF